MTALTQARDALRPCPFCGGPAKIIVARSAEDAEAAWGQCQHCGARCEGTEDAYADRASAIAEWNKRAAVEAEIARGDGWRSRQTMPPDHAWFLAGWIAPDDVVFDQIELLFNSQHDGKWLCQNSGNYIDDTWALWMPLPPPPRKEGAVSALSEELFDKWRRKSGAKECVAGWDANDGSFHCHDCGANTPADCLYGDWEPKVPATKKGR